MSETPDFEKLASTLDRQFRSLINSQESDQSEDLIALRLREIWNARGAADIVKLEAELSSMMGVTASGPYVKNLDRALRSLDR